MSRREKNIVLSICAQHVRTTCDVIDDATINKHFSFGFRRFTFSRVAVVSGSDSKLTAGKEEDKQRLKNLLIRSSQLVKFMRFAW